VTQATRSANDDCAALCIMNGDLAQGLGELWLRFGRENAILQLSQAPARDNLPWSGTGA
jgi:hypothetical protein